MKKVFLAVAIVASSLSFAQKFGVKAGTNISTISTDGYDETKAKMGFYAGAFYNIPVTEMFRIQPEVIYNNLGSEAKGSVLGQPYTRALDLNYISIPVMLQIKPTEHFYVEAGPTFGFLVGAKTNTSYNGTTVIRELNNDDFNKFNLGVGGGLGVDITDNIGINARYIYGFSDVTKPDSDPNIKAKNRNNTVQIGLNYKF
ncbi:MAG: PorT family protein [Cloacibacterium sp.]|jgi:opacity protein-like surface antigen|nr:PorT family protein [Cloacibacterium sp.]